MRRSVFLVKLQAVAHNLIKSEFLHRYVLRIYKDLRISDIGRTPV